MFILQLLHAKQGTLEILLLFLLESLSLSKVGIILYIIHGDYIVMQDVAYIVTVIKGIDQGLALCGIYA